MIIWTEICWITRPATSVPGRRAAWTIYRQYGVDPIRALERKCILVHFGRNVVEMFAVGKRVAADSMAFATRCLFVLVTLLAGCHGDAALPIISSTRLPGTELTIHLGGPDSEGKYGYYIRAESDVSSSYRPLGRLKVKPTRPMPTTLVNEGHGIFRITWGREPISWYAVVDTEKMLFLEDSNPENSKGIPIAMY